MPEWVHKHRGFTTALDVTGNELLNVEAYNAVGARIFERKRLLLHKMDVEIHFFSVNEQNEKAYSHFKKFLNRPPLKTPPS